VLNYKQKATASIIIIIVVVVEKFVETKKRSIT